MPNLKVFVIALVFFLFLLLILFLLLRKRKIKPPEKKEKPYLNPFNYNFLTRKRIEELKNKRLHKKKERALQDLFLEFETDAENDFQKLGRIAVKYKKHRPYLNFNASKTEKKTFQSLENLLQNMKEWENRKQKIAYKDIGQVFNELKKLGKLKK